MCGIGGIIGSDSGSLDGLEQALRHRGPDGRGRFHEAAPCPVGLIHTRLAIQDTSTAGAQPMRSRSGRHVAVYNGEIYNFRTLASELAGSGVQMRSRSDTEVLLEGWELHGPQFLERCRGMFAFAIWDRAEQRLFLVRDRLGIKPVYFAHLPDGGIAFASEVKALLAAGVASSSLDPAGVASFLTLGAVHEPHTILEGVRALEPGTRLEWSPEGERRVSWWQFPRPPGEAAIPRSEAVRMVRSELEEAVQLRLVSDVPVSVLLSSGIDSSAIASLASRHAQRDLQTFTVRLDPEDHLLDEASEAGCFAHALGLSHREVVLRSRAILDDLDRAFAAMDQPTMDGVNTWFVTRAIHREGAVVALSGLGGDELFLGYPSARSLRRSLGLLHLASPLLRAIGYGVDAMAPSGFRHMPLPLLKLLDLPHVRPTVEDLVCFRRSLFPIVGRHALHPADTRSHSSAGSTAGPGDIFARWSRAEMTGYMSNVLLRDTDVFGMAHPVEVRVPFLDHRLVEKVLSLPARVRDPDGRQKPLLVDALGKDLPRHATEGAKRGFVLPTARWMAGALRERMEDIMGDGALWEGAGLDACAVRSVWQRFLRSPNQRSASRPWALLALGTYVRQLLESRPVD